MDVTYPSKSCQSTKSYPTENPQGPQRLPDIVPNKLMLSGKLKQYQVVSKLVVCICSESVQTLKSFIRLFLPPENEQNWIKVRARWLEWVEGHSIDCS